MGRLITIAHSLVRIFEKRTCDDPQFSTLVFKSGDIGAEAANRLRIDVDGESASLQIAGISIPDQNVAGFDAGLLQTLCDGEHQHARAWRCLFRQVHWF